MSPERALLGRGRRERHLRIVPKRPLTVVDCALSYWERSDETRAYLDAKVEFGRRCDEIEHHLLMPTAEARSAPQGRGLLRALDRLEPDVVLLHDPFFKAREVARRVRAKRGVTVVVQHGAASPGEVGRGGSGLYGRALQAWLRRTYDEADAVMAPRFGLHPAFRPHPVEQADHVLTDGRSASEAGLLSLLDTMATSRGDWRLRILGGGPAMPAVLAMGRKLGLGDRIEQHELPSGEALARELAAASCFVAPGARHGFGLMALQAAACGVPVVVPAGARCAPLIGRSAHTFSEGGAGDLLRAIGRARLAPRDPAHGAELADRYTWERALGDELCELGALARC